MNGQIFAIFVSWFQFHEFETDDWTLETFDNAIKVRSFVPFVNQISIHWMGIRFFCRLTFKFHSDFLLVPASKTFIFINWNNKCHKLEKVSLRCICLECHGHKWNNLSGCKWGLWRWKRAVVAALVCVLGDMNDKLAKLLEIYCVDEVFWWYGVNHMEIEWQKPIHLMDDPLPFSPYFPNYKTRKKIHIKIQSNHYQVVKIKVHKSMCWKNRWI